MAFRNRRVFELRVGKLGLSLLVGGISVLIFVFFLLGVLMGRHMEAYPERYASGILDLVWGNFSKTTAGGKPPVGGQEGQSVEEGEFGLTFYEILGAKGTSAKKRSKGRQEDKTPSEASEEMQSAEVANSQPTGREEDPEPSVGPAPGEKGEQGQHKGGFEIQVAAFRERNKANDMAKRIGSLGLNSRVVAKDLPGKGRWFRVIVNGFQDRKGAQDAADLLLEKIPGLRVVIRSASAGD